MSNPPICPYCKKPSRLVKGIKIYPKLTALHDKDIYLCEPCDAYVGCHKGTTNPLGTLADKELRAARMKLHNQVIDPIWKEAPFKLAEPVKGKRAVRNVQSIARQRVYAFMAARMGIPAAECHISMFDIERCREAWRVMRGVEYPEVREWAKDSGFESLTYDPVPIVQEHIRGLYITTAGREAIEAAIQELIQLRAEKSANWREV